MQPNSMAFKVKVLVDNEEIPGLVKFGEVALENGMIDVPGFERIFKIQNGVTTMPSIPLSFETRRNTKTRKFLADWFDKKEQHDVTIIKTDAGGTEFERQLWQDVECQKHTEPEVDFSNVSYAKVDVVLLPYDIIRV